MTITKFTRAACRRVQDDVAVALAGVAERHGIAINPGRGSFTSETFRLTVEMATLGEGGVANTRERREWNHHAELLGLDPDWLDREFESGRARYRVVGLNTRARKFPVKAERLEDGAKFKFPAATVKAFFLGAS